MYSHLQFFVIPIAIYLSLNVVNFLLVGKLFVNVLDVFGRVRRVKFQVEGCAFR